MKSNKFLSILKKLEPEEIDEFSEFLQQYHKKDKIALRVFQYVYLFRPTFDSDKFTIDFIYRKVYKEQLPETTDEIRRKKVKKLLNKFSELSHWLEDFLWYQKISSPSLERDLLFSTILMERKMYRELSQHHSSLKKSLKGSLPGDVPGYLKQVIASYLMDYQFLESVQGPDPDVLPDFIEHLDSFYAVTRLKLACAMATRMLIKPEDNNKFEPAFPLSSLMALLPPGHIQNNPLIAIYANLFRLITNKSKKNYEKVEALFKENLNSIAPREQHDILVLLQNYTASQIRLGKKRYLEIAHDLNVFGIEQGCFTRDGNITATNYTNIINTACTANALDWAWDFAKECSPRLPLAIRKNVTKLGEAIILFEKEDYTGVLSTLPGESFSDTHCEIRSRSMYLRSAWELKKYLSDYDFVLNYCLAFEQYLVNRDKKSKADIVTASLNFVRIFKKMITGHKSKAELIAEIQSHELLYFRKWLLGKNHV
ncbi:MAG: hypothetical protein ACKV1O_28415 [Saprospiraceae bacterium]